MKHIHTKIVLGAMLAFSPMGLMAQDGMEAEDADSLARGNEVNVAFRTLNEKDLMGGVSVVDVLKLTDKNYST